jgi:hypothetical protein
MKRRNVLVVLGMFVLFLTPGCGEAVKIDEAITKNKDKIVVIIKSASESGVELGLKKWSEKQPEAAKEAAVAINRNINEQLLPYLNGSQLPSSAEVREFINSSLFKNVPNEIKLAVVAAAAVLDIYLPVPDSGTFLKPDHVDLIKAFLGGISNGTKTFIDKAEPVFSAPAVKNTWITG